MVVVWNPESNFRRQKIPRSISPLIFFGCQSVGPWALAEAANLGPTFLEAKDALNQALMDSKTAKTALNEVEQALDFSSAGMSSFLGTHTC